MENNIKEIDGTKTLLIGNSSNGNFGFIDWFDGRTKKIEYLSINQYENDNRFYLFLLDKKFETLNDYLEETIEDARNRARQLFPEREIHWRYIHTRQILVEVEFFKEGETSRKASPNLDNQAYRPHFVVKETKEYLGVWFVEGNAVELGEKTVAIVETIYDNVDYGLLFKSDTEFHIVEGANIVGQGKVI